MQRVLCRIASLIALLSASIAVSASAAAQSALHTQDQVVADARLTTLGVKGDWTFAVAGQPLTVDDSNIVRWGAWSGSLRKSAVWLVDGSWMAGRVEFNSATEITVHSEWFQPAKMSLREVRGIVMIAPASINAWNRLQSQLGSTSGSRDAVWLKGNRQISGVLRITIDEFDQLPRIAIDNAGQSLNVDSAEIVAIAFSPTLLGPVPLQANQRVLALDDGSRLNIRKLNDEQSRVRVELMNGTSLLSLDSRPEFSRGITCVSNQPPRTKFLTELEPASYKHVAQSQLTWPLGKNKDLLDRPLMIAMEATPGIVDRGLAMHSSSQVAYRIDGSKQRFLAEVTLATPADGADVRLGNAVCQVMVARAGKLQTVESFTLDRDRNPTKLLEVDLTSGQLLVLLTDQGNFAQYGDHILWLDARIATDAP